MKDIGKILVMCIAMFMSIGIFQSVTFAQEQPKDQCIHLGDVGSNRTSRGGGMAVETDKQILATLSANKDKFQQFTYNDEETGISLEYSLYIPESYNKNDKLPMVIYIPDASGAGKSAKEIVTQYYGASVWASDEEQQKHPSFVLVPAFSGVVTDDDWNTSKQIDVAVKLIKQLCKDYSIDENRLYITGQSMGCMTSLYLNSKYPNMFAASLFVGGQWDISVLKTLETESFFYITAGGDEKASKGQKEVMDMFDADGINYTYAKWNAQNKAQIQDNSVKNMLEKNYKANFIQFQTGSVLKDGNTQEHMASFNYAYKLTAVRDWLFRQSK